MKSGDRNFHHFLITQFNLLKFPLGNGMENESSWLNWTRERIKIFKTYCLPSLDNQTNKDFTWLIYFDKKTPKEFAPLFKELESRKFIKVCFADGFDGFMIQYLHDIKRLNLDKKWVVTSRIDNDDCFHQDAIDVIQRNFKAQDGFFISLASGNTLNVNTKTMGHYIYPMSPFISHIERSDKDEIKSVYYKSHGHWDELKLNLFHEIMGNNRMSKFVLTKPYWIQVVHGDNVSNSEKRGFPVLRKKDLTCFGLDIISKSQSVCTIPSYYNYVHWKRYFVAMIVRLFRR